VWLLLLIMAVAYGMAWRRRDQIDRTSAEGPRPGFFLCGMAALWAVIDWPVGALGAGYLLSVHMLQYIVLSMIVPPLLLRGVGPSMLRGLLLGPAVAPFTRFLAKPLVAFVVFNLVLVATHLPPVVDAVKVSQLGSFAMDAAWLGAGLVFWVQVLAPLPELAPLRYPGRIVFLLANVFIPTVPASFLTFSDFPIYAVYEQAVRVGTLTATEDQQLAGLTMKIVGGLIIFGTATVFFFKWYRQEEREERQVRA
jgi:putative membrane protein